MGPVVEADHISDEQCGGTELVKIRKKHEVPQRRPLPYGFRSRMVEAVPSTRADCPTDRDVIGCPHVRCRHHMWRLDSWDRPGRPSVDPETGLLKRPPTILRRYTRSSCGLDIVAENPLGIRATEIAKLEDKSRRRLQQEIKRAVLKLKAAGVDVSEFLELLRQERNGPQTTDTERRDDD